MFRRHNLGIAILLLNIWMKSPFASAEYLLVKYFRPSDNCFGGVNNAIAWLCDTCIPRDSGITGSAFLECDKAGLAAHWKYFSDKNCELQYASSTWMFQTDCMANSAVESQTAHFLSTSYVTAEASSIWGNDYAVLTRYYSLNNVNHPCNGLPAKLTWTAAGLCTFKNTGSYSFAVTYGCSTFYDSWSYSSFNIPWYGWNGNCEGTASISRSNTETCTSSYSLGMDDGIWDGVKSVECLNEGNRVVPTFSPVIVPGKQPTAAPNDGDATFPTAGKVLIGITVAITVLCLVNNCWFPRKCLTHCLRPRVVHAEINFTAAEIYRNASNNPYIPPASIADQHHFSQLDLALPRFWVNSWGGATAEDGTEVSRDGGVSQDVNDSRQVEMNDDSARYPANRRSTSRSRSRSPNRAHSLTTNSENQTNAVASFTNESTHFYGNLPIHGLIPVETSTIAIATIASARVISSVSSPDIPLMMIPIDLNSTESLHSNNNTHSRSDNNTHRNNNQSYRYMPIVADTSSRRSGRHRVHVPEGTVVNAEHTVVSVVEVQGYIV